ncbi:MAG: phosphatidate cytidylyltransferase [Bacteroidetes bacterium]|nr:phosphatidate cytidylyltransferase [Bacteroidota bacterium]
MALNFATLKTRSITAAVFVVVMMAGLFINGWLFLTLFAVIMCGAFIEFIKIIFKINKSLDIKYLLFGILYILIPFTLLFYMAFGRWFNPIFYSPVIPAAILFSIWINDTMAYIVGSLIGKTPFSSISPKKTWEGTIGGAILCVGVITLLSNLILSLGNNDYYRLTRNDIFIISVICAVFGTAGDLLESKFKRMAGIKDSGNIMPGHGGFLDRFDSLIVAAPFVWLYLEVVR